MGTGRSRRDFPQRAVRNPFPGTTDLFATGFRGKASSLLVTLLIALTSVGLTGATAPRPADDFSWNPDFSTAGPVVIIISLGDQTLSAYRNGVRIAHSTISSGRRGRSTPAGVFTILEKQVVHYSSKYHHAPMPYMQRLTWQGIALHGGDLPGYPASHGCIRLPHEFAKLLYSITTRGTTVVVVNEKAPQPVLGARPGLVLWPERSGKLPSLPGEFEWTPERSPEGPITILASAADRAIYVYRNGQPIGHAILTLNDSKTALGSHVFTMLSGLSDEPSAFVRGRPGHQWMAVKTEGKTTLHDLARRVRISPEFAGKVYDILEPGTTIVVTDDPALGPATPGRAVRLMESGEK